MIISTTDYLLALEKYINRKLFHDFASDHFHQWISQNNLCFNDCPFDFAQSNCIDDVAVTSDINRRRMGRPVFMPFTFYLSRFEMELQLYNQQNSGSPSEVEEETVRISDDYAMLSQSLDVILADEGFAEMDSSKVLAALKFVL